MDLTYLTGPTNATNKKLIQRQCKNCGSLGHILKECVFPILSIGIITFTIDDCDQSVIDHLINKFSNTSPNIMMKDTKTQYIKLKGGEIHCTDKSKIAKFLHYRDKIKFLMITRKHSLGFVEFISGNYDPHNEESIISLFRQMQHDEYRLIEQNDIIELILWSKDIHDDKTLIYNTRIYKELMKTYHRGIVNYEILSRCEKNKIYYTTLVNPDFNIPEWGFPKGRRNNHEKNIICAKREFAEETGYTNIDYRIFHKIKPISEKFPGTNGKKYKHTYYIGYLLNNTIKHIGTHNSSEIGNIKLLTYEEAFKCIRSYHRCRRKILTLLYSFIMNNIDI